MMQHKKIGEKISLLLLIALNLYPIFGLLFLGWEINFIFSVYLVETLILVIFSTIKMLMTEKILDDESFEFNLKFGSAWTKMSRREALSNFLALLYIFVFVVYGLYLVPWDRGAEGNAIFGFSITSVQYLPVIYFLVLSILSHSVSFFINFILNDERKNLAISEVFNRVMIGRIMPLFISPFIIIFLHKFGIVDSHNIKLPIFVILGLFAIFDISAYMKEHRKIV